MTVATNPSIVTIGLANLQVAPWNARKTPTAIDELASTIKAHGIQSPLIVRPVGARSEIVAGHRRFAAAQLLKLEAVPCIVRQLDDSQARLVAMVDNLQREDLPPLEEAQGFKELLIRSEVEIIAGQVGKSASYVTRRLKLLDAIKPVQDALKAAAIEVGHALELARLSDDQQKDILNAMEIGWHQDDDEASDEWGVCKFCGCDEMHACQLPDGAPCSWINDEETVCSNPECVEKQNRGDRSFRPTTWTVADLKHHIRRNACRNLNTAPFTLDDADLGEIACRHCPKRTMNAVLLFNDLAGSDTCTDSSCFDRKSAAFVQIQIKTSVKAKKPLVKISDSYSSEKDVLRDYQVRIIGKDGVKSCDNRETAIWIAGRNLGQTVEICRKNGCKIHGRSESSSSSKSSSDPSAERKKVLAKVKVKKAYHAALVKAIAEAAVPSSVLEHLLIEVCCNAFERANSQQIGKVAIALGWPDSVVRWNNRKALREKLSALSGSDRLRSAVLAIHCSEIAVQEYNLTTKPEDLERIAKLLNVDLKKLQQQPATPPSPKKSATPKKAILSSDARKRIAAAQKKRWATQKKGAGK